MSMAVLQLTFFTKLGRGQDLAHETVPAAAGLAPCCSDCVCCQFKQPSNTHRPQTLLNTYPQYILISVKIKR